jgi:hypothetical protein
VNQSSDLGPPEAVSTLRTWYPIVRDYAALILGAGAGAWGIYSNNAAVATLGFGVAGFGAIGKVRDAVNGE